MRDILTGKETNPRVNILRSGKGTAVSMPDLPFRKMSGMPICGMILLLFLIQVLLLFPRPVLAGSAAMYRMYNPNSGEHFYTAASGERNYLIRVGWNYEGIGWYAPEQSDNPVYRLYNANAGDHHYTMNYGEMRRLRELGWSYEGIGWYSDPQKAVPVYRQYNPNARTGSHNFTTSRAENDSLALKGWTAEGISWYGVRASSAGTSKDHPAWNITQYATVTGQQGMFYTIEDADQHLAIIDGGYEEDADQVLRVIRSHGSHVTDWIITHPHPDHVGALNAVLRKMRDGQAAGVQIDHIYVTAVNRKRYEETAQDYDGIEAYENFLDLTQGMRNVTSLSENDEVSILGLSMKVIHAWDSHVDALSRNLCNDGSLMFVLAGNKKRFLFCGDTQKEMEPYITAAHGNDLHADYVQCGHHGNWGLTSDFYDLVSPAEAFMDAPSYIMNDTSGTFDAPALKAYFKNKNIPVHDLPHAPYTVTLS